MKRIIFLIKERVVYAVIFFSLSFTFLVLGARFISRSAITEGRLKGEKFFIVLNNINENEREIVETCKVSGVNPRILGAAIYSERALNYLPVFENIFSFAFGQSLGFSQVNMNALAWALKMLWLPTQDDSIRYILKHESEFSRLRRYFSKYQRYKLWQLKLELWRNQKFNIACSALVLKLTMIRYATSENGFDVSNNPAIASTLYHIKFPQRITGNSDEWGRLSEKIFFDKHFMPTTTYMISEAGTSSSIWAHKNEMGKIQ